MLNSENKTSIEQFVNYNIALLKDAAEGEPELIKKALRYALQDYKDASAAEFQRMESFVASLQWQLGYALVNPISISAALTSEQELEVKEYLTRLVKAVIANPISAFGDIVQSQAKDDEQNASSAAASSSSSVGSSRSSKDAVAAKLPFFKVKIQLMSSSAIDCQVNALFTFLMLKEAYNAKGGWTPDLVRLFLINGGIARTPNDNETLAEKGIVGEGHTVHGILKI